MKRDKLDLVLATICALVIAFLLITGLFFLDQNSRRDDRRDQDVKYACIKAHGNWSYDEEGCTFTTNQGDK